jgi:solute carrier family 6 (neurotransmitter transporter, GABA) member 1
VTVAADGGWDLPVAWPIVLRYITSPILAIVFSFAYPSFAAVNNDPLHIFAFGLMHLVMLFIGLGFALPRFFDVFVPADRRGENELTYAPRVLMGTLKGERERAAENGDGPAATAEGETPSGTKGVKSETPLVEATEKSKSST